MRPLLALVLACGEVPEPLPPSSQTPPVINARRVRAAGLDGYLARPSTSDTPSLLVLADEIDESLVQLAKQRATDGSTVLVVGSETSQDRGIRYLLGLTTVTARPEVLCRRADCSETVR